MMVLIFPKKHSKIDVITNSSTSIFSIDYVDNLDEIKNILLEMLNAYNKESGRDLSFYDVFEEPYIYHYIGGESSGLYEYKIRENDCKIIVEGCNDNSIPYGLVEEISEVLVKS